MSAEAKRMSLSDFMYRLKGFRSWGKERRTENAEPQLAPTVILHELAEEFAFSKDWPQATKRLDSFTDAFFEYGDLSHPRFEDVFKRANAVVDALEGSYDYENENTLQQVGALITRQGAFLQRLGLTQNEVLHHMLKRAVEYEMRRHLRSAKKEVEEFFIHGVPDLYYFDMYREAADAMMKLNAYAHTFLQKSARSSELI